MRPTYGFHHGALPKANDNVDVLADSLPNAKREAVFVSSLAPGQRLAQSIVLGTGGCLLALSVLETRYRSCFNAGSIRYDDASEVPDDYRCIEYGPVNSEALATRLKAKKLAAKALFDREVIGGRRFRGKKVLVASIVDTQCDWEDAVAFLFAARSMAFSPVFVGIKPCSGPLPLWAVREINPISSSQICLRDFDDAADLNVGDGWSEACGQLAQTAARYLR